MARRSSIDELAPEIVAAVKAAIRDGNTIDEIVALIRSLGGEASRSSVGRYRKQFVDVAAKMRQAQAVAKVWVDQVGTAPEGELGRLVVEMIRTVAFKTAMDATDSDDPAEPQDVMFLAKAMQHLASSDKITAELTLRLRREMAAKLDDAVGEAAAAGEHGLSAERVTQLRREFLGAR